MRIFIVTIALMVFACERGSHGPTQNVEDFMHRVHCELRDGEVTCQGNNQFGIVRAPPANEVAPATPIPLPERATALGLEDLGWSACAVGESGAVYCWGNNDEGMLGIGTTPVIDVAHIADMRANLYPVPQRVVDLPAALDISMGDSACALTRDHAVYCWGANHDGSLGRPGDTPSGVPVRILDSSIDRVVVGARQLCALRDDHHVLYWGNGVAPPAEVPDLDDAISIEARNTEICAQRRKGPERCWDTAAPRR